MDKEGRNNKRKRKEGRCLGKKTKEDEGGKQKKMKKTKKQIKI